MALRVESKSKRAWVCSPALVLALALALSGAASAHRPLFSGTKAAHPDAAVRIADPSVSHVIYAELTAGAPQSWFVLDTAGPREVAVQLGVPAEPRRQVADPVVVLFGPGLPDPPDRLPLAPPQEQGLGVLAIKGTGTSSPFHEPVTGTRSRIHAETRLRLPSAGTYYGAVYDASRQGGKVWLAIGQREGFTWGDLPRLPGWIGDVRRFHEVSGWPRWAWMGTGGLLAAGSLVLGWVIRRRR